jgi:heme exporter protein D
MGNMDGWDLALLVMAGYVAVVALVRLMIRRRDQVLGEFRRKLRQERQRKQAEEASRNRGRGRTA